MLIYTGGTGDAEKIAMLHKYNMGIMISSTPNKMPPRTYGKHKCAIDNGAWACHRKGYPFQEDIFLKALSTAYKNGITLDFIVCPDLLMGGGDSLDFSLSWATGKLKTANNLSLVVQDGMKPYDIDMTAMINRFTHIFVGGSVDWKWETTEMWREYATSKGKKLHVGGCGTLDKLNYCKKIGVDSVDSTSFVRNNSWHIIEQFYEEKSLFKSEALEPLPSAKKEVTQ